MLRIQSLLLLAVISLLSDRAVAAEAIRSGDGWAIHTQAVPEDWARLVAGGDLIAAKLVRPQPGPNDHNTGSELKHLTDGGLAGADGRMWSDKRAMGWAYQPYARLTFDLEKSQPVGQVVMRLQVISQTSTLPGKITVSLSDDGEEFSPVRVLSVRTKLSDDPQATYEALPFDPPGIYAVVLDVGYQARFVQLDFALTGTMVTDEMAIVPAKGEVKKIPPPVVTSEYRDYVFDRRDQFRKMTAAGNLLLGKRLHYSPAPTQFLTVDHDDPLQLVVHQL